MEIILPKNPIIIVPIDAYGICTFPLPRALPAGRASPILARMSNEQTLPLAETSSEVIVVPNPAPEPAPPPKRISGMRGITYDAIIDFVLSNPRATRKEIATAFGYKSEQSITILINSDAFQARLHARREDLIDPLILGNVQDRIKGLADKSIAILEQKLEGSADGNFALKVLEVTQKSQDYGAKPPGVNAQFVVNLPGPASSSDEWMRKFAPADAPILRPDPSNLPSE